MQYNLDPMFNPKSVAVIGASRNPQSVGHACLKNLISAKFPGKIYPVNPKAEELLGLKVYNTVDQIPQDVDLAVIAIPSRFIPNTIDQCGQKGVKAIIVISAGFKETGEEGAKLEQQVVDIANKYQIPLLGPNVLGLLNVPAHLNASFGPTTPEPGHIGFISQSGALGSGILDWSVVEKVGFSKFVSIGNKAVLNEVDFIEYFGEDPETRVILVYIESIADGQRFLQVARKVTKKKPVIIIKGGRSEEGAKAASSHTGSLAGQFVAYETAFKQTGVLFVETAQELFDVAYAFESQPIPATRQTAIVTNAGGPGILAADAVAANNLILARFEPETIEKLREVLPPVANFYDPVDVIGDARADRYEAAMDIVLADPNVDNLLVLLTMQAMTEPLETAKAIVKVAKKYPNKAIVTSFIGGADITSSQDLFREHDIPYFEFPFRAVTALLALNKFGEYSRKPQSNPPDLENINKDEVKKIFRKVRKEERVTLLADESTNVVRAYGINASPTVLATTREEAIKASKKLGFPVVLKIASPQIIHKTDIGGVILNLKNPKEVGNAYDEIMANARKYVAGAKLYGVTIQFMAPKGRELILGMSRDVQFGPLIMFGLGGIFVNFLKDVSFRLAPLTLEDAEQMINETKASTLLKGVRGELPSDIPAIIDTLIRMGHLVNDFPEILEMDINPLFAFNKGKGINALDVKITLAPIEEK